MDTCFSRRRFSMMLLVAALAGASSGYASDAAPKRRIGVGDVAPDFSLLDQDGRRHALSAERGKRPVVLVFYRGHW